MTSTLATQLAEHIRVHHEDGILLDTNVLLLLLIAQFDPAFIGRKRLEKYTPDDAQLLIAFAGKFNRILTTSHILAETSNLAAQALTGRRKDEFFNRLFPIFSSGNRDALHQCPIATVDFDRAIFVRLGLTDAGVIAAINIDAKRLLLTDDLDLYSAAVGKGVPSINFTHMREAAGLL
jgi:hypothetical protein